MKNNKVALRGNLLARNKSKRFYIHVALCIGILMAVIAIILILVLRNTAPEQDLTETGQLTTAEEKAVTKKILENDVEIEIKGYEEVEGQIGNHGTITIVVKNVSDQTVNYAFSVAALNEEGHILDKTSLYAEGIQPNQSQIFYAFALSELSAEQLKSAEYKIYKANTYERDNIEENVN